MANCIDCHTVAPRGSSRCWACWDTYIAQAANEAEATRREFEMVAQVVPEQTQPVNVRGDEGRVRDA